MSAKNRARLRRQVHYRHRGAWNRRCAKEHDQLTARSCARVAKWMTDSMRRRCDRQQTATNTFVGGSCLFHADMRPDDECECMFHRGGDPLNPDCEYVDHSCEICDEHAARCANFAAWMAVRKTAQS